MRVEIAFLGPIVLLGCGDAERSPAPPSSESRSVPVPTEFVRFVDRGADRAALETAIVSYEGTGGASVDLIAVVHLGDPDYYAALARDFGGYDAVLYEMIKPEGLDPAAREEGQSPVSAVQRALCRALDLRFQLQALDYGRANFVHADLTTEEFSRLWEERDESFLRVALRAMAGAGGGGSEMTPAALFAAARSPKRAARLKLLLGREFSQLERTMAGIGDVGDDGRDRSMLVGARNQAAVEVLKQRLGAGDRRVAVLYGAGHGPDLDVRLTQDLGLSRRAVSWRTAWEIDATGG